MCGRYTLTYADLGEVAAELEALIDPAAAALHRPRYNVAPTNAAVVARDAEGRAALVPAVWGLHRDRRLIINVRAESAASRFARAYEQARCIVPADGFYEWTGEAKERRPLWFHLPEGAPLFMAGILDPPGEGELPAFAVLTAPSRPPIAPAHDRMPVLLSAAGARRWLLGRPPRVIVPDDLPLAARAVSPRANAVAHDDPACIEPAGAAGAQDAQEKQLGLFQR
jgi:putative SOS response-associated peptidase YedK